MRVRVSVRIGLELGLELRNGLGSEFQRVLGLG